MGAPEALAYVDLRTHNEGKRLKVLNKCLQCWQRTFFCTTLIHCITTFTKVHTYFNSMMHLLCIKKWEEGTYCLSPWPSYRWDFVLPVRHIAKGEDARYEGSAKE